MAEPSPIYLTILRQGDTNLIDLAEVGTLIPRSEIRVDDAFLQEVTAEILSLARLWQQQGKTKHAYRMLSEIYNWFTEGFDTMDLQEAKALLVELS